MVYRIYIISVFDNIENAENMNGNEGSSTRVAEYVFLCLSLSLAEEGNGPIDERLNSTLDGLKGLDRSQGEPRIAENPFVLSYLGINGSSHENNLETRKIDEVTPKLSNSSYNLREAHTQTFPIYFYQLME